MKRCPQCSNEYPDATQFCPRDGRNLEADDPIIGRVIGGRYRVSALVGKGGMGAVYRGEHVRMRRATAIKVLAPSLASNPEFVARFQREAELASTLSHPHAVSIYDFGEDDGLVYLAMEFLEGEALSSLLARSGTLPVDSAIRIARQAAEALEAAHRRGIIHRDFKPDNVMLCSDGSANPVVKVVDFGIAKQTQGVTHVNNLTQTGSVLGTPTYMSPEQVADRPLDGRSDLYSLALVVFQMLAGTLPFKGDTVQSIMVMRLLEDPTPLRMIAPHISPSVESVVMKGLAREPQQRQTSVLDFVTDLERAATSTAVMPATPSYPQTATSFPPPDYTTPSGHGAPTSSGTTPNTGPASYVNPAMSQVPTPTSYPPHTSQPSFQPMYQPTPTGIPGVAPRPKSGAKFAAAAVAGLLLLIGVPVGSYVGYLAYSNGMFGNGDTNGNPGDTNRGVDGPSNANPTGPDATPNAEYLVSMARDLRAREDYEGAEEKAREAVKADPKSCAAAVMLADVLLDLSKNSEGGKYAEIALELDRKDAGAHRAVATHALAERQFGQAIEEAKKSLALGPGPDDEAFANLVLGSAYMHQTLYDPALESFNRARAYRGANAMIMVLARLGVADVLSARGNADSGIKDLTALAADASLRPNLRALVYRDLAKLALVQQRPADAVSNCETALSSATITSLRAGILVIEGLAYVLQRKPTDALAKTEEGLRIAGEDREIQGYGQAVRGASLVMLGRVAEGRDALKMARQLLPDDTDIASLAQKAGVDG